MRGISIAAVAGSALLAGVVPAGAADMAVKARPIAPPPAAFSWTGFYVGANVGGGWTPESGSSDFGPLWPGFIVLAPQSAQLPTGQAADVGAVHQNAAGRGLDQQVEQAYQRGFARTGQAHDHKDFTRLNGESGVEYADRVAGTLQNLVLAATLADKLQCLLRRLAEDFEPMVCGDFFGPAGGSPSLKWWNKARPPLADRFEAIVRP